MSMPTVYVETSVIGYAAARDSRDLIVLARQQLTREWLAGRAQGYQLFISQLVIQEISAGDRVAAAERLALISEMEQLPVTDVAGALSTRLVGSGAVPHHAAEDALHIAIAATNGLDYLVTWNCTHIANAARRFQIEDVCREGGSDPPLICTPEALHAAP